MHLPYTNGRRAAVDVVAPPPPVVGLGYAPRVAVYRRLSVRRGVLVAVLLAAIAAGRVWGPPLADRVRLAYWEHRCGTCQVTAVDDVGRRDGAGRLTDPAAVAFERFAKLESPHGSSGRAIAFLHDRITPSGQRRLVAVEMIERATSPPLRAVSLFSRVFLPGGLTRRTREVPAVNQPPLNLWGLDRVGAGQPDPADASHFTIPCVWEGRPEVIDGWLRDDDSVVLELRDGGDPITRARRQGTRPRTAAP